MSNPAQDPDLIRCGAGVEHGVEVLTAREVPWGGPRAMTVRRALPQRRRPLIGAWCLVDHHGPDQVGGTGGMSVAPHPHTGLATLCWLFTGEVEHRDGAGHPATAHPASTVSCRRRSPATGGPPGSSSVCCWGWSSASRPGTRVDGGYGDGRFGVPVGDAMTPLLTPRLLDARLRARR